MLALEGFAQLFTWLICSLHLGLDKMKLSFKKRGKSHQL